MDLWRVAGDADRHDRLRGSTIGAWAAALAVGLAAVLGPALPLADAASFRIAALIPDQNPFYDAYYEIINMTIQEEQAEGILAAHDVALDYTLYEFDQGYLLSDVDTFSNGSVVGFIGELLLAEGVVSRGVSGDLQAPDWTLARPTAANSETLTDRV